MGKQISNRQIDRVCIIDDDPEGRAAMELTIEDSELIAVPQNVKIQNLDTYFAEVIKHHDAVVSDHHLRKKNYFPVNGAEVVARCYTNQIPSVLVTKWEDASVIDEIRRFRQKIPVILNPEEFEPDSLIKSLEICINEFNGEFRPSRKVWRALIRVDYVADNHFYFIIPSWNPNEGISLPIADLPENIRVILNDDVRLHAKVNMEASSKNEMFFINWEPK